MVINFETFDKEVEFILSELSRLKDDGIALTDICIVARTEEALQRYERSLESSGVSTYHIRRSAPDDRKQSGLRLATMHRVKGLQFEYVFISSVNDRLVPPEFMLSNAGDKVAKRELEDQERRLLHVAATRAKREVTVTSFGTPSKLLEHASLLNHSFKQKVSS